jgi:ubiquinone/menaquinone biosynthesis C-methylase UbiE
MNKDNLLSIFETLDKKQLVDLPLCIDVNLLESIGEVFSVYIDQKNVQYKFKNTYLFWDYLTNCYVNLKIIDLNFISNIVAIDGGHKLLHKLDKIQSIFEWNSLNDLVEKTCKSGTFKTYEYLTDKSDKLDKENKPDILTLLLLSFYNKDNRITTELFTKLYETDNPTLMNNITSIIKKCVAKRSPNKYILKLLKFINDKISISAYITTMICYCSNISIIPKLIEFYGVKNVDYIYCDNVLKYIVEYDNYLTEYITKNDINIMIQNTNLCPAYLCKILNKYNLTFSSDTTRTYLYNRITKENCTSCEELLYDCVLHSLRYLDKQQTTCSLQNCMDTAFSANATYCKEMLLLASSVGYINVSIYCTNIIRWNKFRYLFKILLRTKYKYKTVNRKLNTNSLLHEITHHIPNTYYPVLKNGGRKYIVNRQQFKSKDNPVHLKPQNYFSIINKEYLIHEKADGIKMKSLPNDVFPKIDNTVEIKCEWIEEFDIYLIFDINIPDTTIDERYKYLRETHPFCHDIIIKTVNTYDEYIYNLQLERDNLMKFINRNSGTLWYPKCVFKTNSKELLDMLITKTIIEPDDVLLKYKIPLDGLIIQPLSNNNQIKLKPNVHLTIDVLWNGTEWLSKDNKTIQINNTNNILLKVNSIYRCYRIDDIWIPKDLRWEKNTPNSNLLIDEITKLYYFDWTQVFNDMSHHYYNKENYYSNYCPNYLKNILKDGKDDLIHMIEQMKLNKSNTYLDLGCGKGRLIDLIAMYLPKYYIGFDIDSNIINKVKQYYPQHDFRQCDLGSNVAHPYEFNDIPIFESDNIFIINSFAYSHKNETTINNWINAINKYSKCGTKLLINYINKDAFEDTYSFKNNYVKKINDNLLKIYFEWSHNEPIEEPLLDKSKVINLMNENGWTLNMEYIPKSSTLNSLFVWQIFSKK